MRTNSIHPSTIADAELLRESNRILQPVHDRDHWPRVIQDGQSVTRLAVIDLETTGLDPRRHKAIEFSMVMLALDESGHIAAIEGGGSGLVDPGYPITPEIEALTGITSAMVAGKRINEPRAMAFLQRADYLCSFNAGFDRPHLERLLPAIPQLPWCCAMKDIDWRAIGFEPGPQAWLLAQAGYFNSAIHRAESDVQSLCTLLDHTLNDGETVMAKLLRTAREPAWRFEAKHAPFRFKEDLKEWRYSYSSRHKLWHKHVRRSDFRFEYARYRKHLGQRPAVVPLQACDRYRTEWDWRPA